MENNNRQTRGKKLDFEENSKEIKTVLRIRNNTSGKPSYLEILNDKEIMCNVQGSQKKFGFSKVYGENSTQEDIFEEVGREPTEQFLRGSNVAVVTYGVTCSGKTYTLHGTEENPGLVKRALELVFEKANTEKVYFLSMLEIYNETVVDLLVEKISRKTKPLELRGTTQVYVQGLRHLEVSSAEQALAYVRQALKNRKVAETELNHESSRSHLVLTLDCCDTQDKESPLHTVASSQLCLVDLAGSERARRTGATGKTMAEASSINLSLTTFNNCIRALRSIQQGHTEVLRWRESKLTYLLQNCFSSGSIVMVINVNPSPKDAEETLQVLHMSAVACGIRTNATSSNTSTPLKSDAFPKLQKKIKELETANSALREKTALLIRQMEREAQERVEQVLLEASERLERLSRQKSEEIERQKSHSEYHLSQLSELFSQLSEKERLLASSQQRVAELEALCESLRQENARLLQTDSGSLSRESGLKRFFKSNNKEKKKERTIRKKKEVFNNANNNLDDSTSNISSNEDNFVAVSLNEEIPSKKNPKRTLVNMISGADRSFRGIFHQSSKQLLSPRISTAAIRPASPTLASIPTTPSPKKRSEERPLPEENSPSLKKRRSSGSFSKYLVPLENGGRFSDPNDKENQTSNEKGSATSKNVRKRSSANTAPQEPLKKNTSNGKIPIAEFSLVSPPSSEPTEEKKSARTPRKQIFSFKK